MKRVGVVLTFLAALQFASGDARLCCNWALFVQAPVITASSNSEWTATCPNCPQTPAQGIPVGGCACPSVTGTETRPVEVAIHISQERLIKASDAQAPPLVAMAAVSNVAAHIGIDQDLPGCLRTSVYILHSAFLI